MANVAVVERTLALIKPDALSKSEEVLDVIRNNGFTVLQKRRVRLSPEEASDLYAEHYGKLFFPSLIAYMSSGPILALVLAKENAIADWRKLLGPTSSKRARQEDPESLRAKYGTDDTRNGLHGSDSQYSAEKEIRFIFPGSVTEPIPQGDDVRDYLGRAVNPVLIQGLTYLCKEKPEEPILWLADWLLTNNPNKPQVDEPSDSS